MFSLSNRKSSGSFEFLGNFAYATSAPFVIRQSKFDHHWCKTGPVPKSFVLSLRPRHTLSNYDFQNTWPRRGRRGMFLCLRMWFLVGVKFSIFENGSHLGWNSGWSIICHPLAGEYVRGSFEVVKSRRNFSSRSWCAAFFFFKALKATEFFVAVDTSLVRLRNLGTPHSRVFSKFLDFERSSQFFTFTDPLLKNFRIS